MKSSSGFLLVWILAAAAVSSSCLQLRGAGSSAVGVLLQDLSFHYESRQTDIRVEYARTGSGGGECRIKNPATCTGAGTTDILGVDFAVSEIILNEADAEKYPDLQMYPMVGGAVAPVYNLPELDGQSQALRLSMEILAGVYTCNITHWDHPSIRALNPGMNELPHTPIQVVARADSSGTTDIFKRALAVASPSLEMEADVATSGGVADWTCAQGSDNFRFKEGSAGLASSVLATPYSLGYLSYGPADTLGMNMAALASQSGELAQLTLATLSAALASTPLPPGLRLEGGEGSGISGTVSAGWPIFGYSSFILRTNAQVTRLREGATCENVEEMALFLLWFYTSEVAQEAAELNGFGTLPDETRDEVVTHLLSNMRCESKPAIKVAALGRQQSNLLTLRGDVPLSVASQLKGLPVMYKSKDPFSKIAFDRATSLGCEGRLAEEELFRVAFCPYFGQDLLDDDQTLIPLAVHPYVVLANIPGVESIVLDHRAAQALVSGEIASFNDPYLVALNPQLNGVTEGIQFISSPEAADMQLLFTDVSDLQSLDASRCLQSASVCTATNAAASLIVAEREYSLTIVPLHAVHQYFDKLVAGVMRDDGLEVHPDSHDMHSCVENDMANPACHPLILRSGIIFNTDYTGALPHLARRAVEFWAWVLQELAPAATPDGLGNIISHREGPYRADIASQLLALRVAGDTVLPTPSDGSSAIVIGALALFICLACGGTLLWRTLTHKGKVARLADADTDGTDWNADDSEAPIFKITKYLQKLAQGGVKGPLQGEASALLEMVKSADNLQLPAGLAALQRSNSALELPETMKYILCLGKGGQQHRNTATSFQMICTDSGPDSDGASSRDALEQSQLNFFTAADGVPPQMAGLSLKGVGTSLFCNVLHLKAHGLDRPLTFITMNILRGNNLIKDLKLDEAKLQRFLTFVETTYNTDNPYHNNWHAADVTLRCAAIVHSLELPATKHAKTSKLAVILGACIHDAGHPGVDNNFMIRQEERLARDFNNQHVLEMHSLHTCLDGIRQDPGLNFLEGSLVCGRQAWLKFKGLLIDIVLATDMGQHFEILNKFNTKMAGVSPSSDDFRQTVEENLPLVLQVSIKAADLGHCASRLAAHKYWSKCLENEFFAQGDRERDAGMCPISFLMDRAGTSCMEASSQVSFFDFIVMPLYTNLGKVFPGVAPLAEQANSNYRHWKLLSQKPGRAPNLSLQEYERDVAAYRMHPTLEDHTESLTGEIGGVFGTKSSDLRRPHSTKRSDLGTRMSRRWQEPLLPA